ncbi:MAG: imidazoleglycerol-phosphate dehydratase [Cenarchaeum sp. SB0665_bin_23]|nr:imidazoleglycerol-phosphate dehydratase [Cenarchaeum sp. SB0664_bin_35]MXY60825.1 imidazoleglycerol-phosphate dehydratase [Cenarchaeum sp. SB0665_bin_23]MYB47072.1 imidazoleglycerol-phosphate dehydratase [Cenarchaeum sp. SB0662_bin_33]MYG33281.1 imidazoleglycerol-phosphate dehydratase [Cenarchaeum sp. SB0677_bin_16]
MMEREAQMSRETSETGVDISLRIDGTGQASIDSTVGFIDHLITSLARHSMIDITLRGKSHDNILHHVIEDTAITLGMALCDGLGERNGIFRFADCRIPMDESLAECCVDLVRRPYHMVQLGLSGPIIEGVPKEDIEHFFNSLLQNMEACIHIRTMYGSNDHHIAEAAIKALAISLRKAASPDAERVGPASTKGTM